MKNVIMMLLIMLSLICWGQDFSIHINLGDFSNSKEVSTIYAKRANAIFVRGDSSIDTCLMEVNNGKILMNAQISHSIIPEDTGSATVEATVKFKNGQIIKRSKTYKVIEYPALELQLVENNLLTNGTIEFQIYSGNKNLTSEFGIGYFEIQILSKEGESVFQTPTVVSLKLDFKKYGLQFKIEKKQTLKISFVRLLWKEHNLPAFTKEYELKIE